MKVAFQEHIITLSSAKPIEITDITDQVKAFVKESGLKNGMLHIGSPHTTVGLIINECCQKLQEDMQDFFARLAPPDAKYRHNLVSVDDRPNAHSHLLSMFLPNQLTIVMRDGELNLGKWQSIFAVDLDGPRAERKITLTLMGG